MTFLGRKLDVCIHAYMYAYMGLEHVECLYLMYIYICICMYIHVHVYVYLYIYVYVFMFISYNTANISNGVSMSRSL